MELETRLVMPGMLFATALVITGCGGVQKDAEYEGVADLRSAIIDSGFDCPGEKVLNEGEEEELLRCSSDLDLRLFTSEEAQKLGDLYGAVSNVLGGADSILIGPNWHIESNNAELLGEIRDELGGELTVN